jgi:FMNH2-dependent dimethyl sulfone monooxygenase
MSDDGIDGSQKLFGRPAAPVTGREISMPMSNNSDQTVDRNSLRILRSPNKLKLGVFGFNISGGPSGITFADGPPKIASWDEVKSVAVAADEAGLEALVPIGRWKGFGGPSGYWDRSLETFTWAAGIAEATKDIHIFTTCHVGIIHPLLAAKMGATIDFISKGRWGLNIVAGWLGAEFDMFGEGLPPHTDRYGVAAEWLDVVKKLWTESNAFDFDGKYFQMKGAITEPKTVQSPYPLIMNAGHSPTGQKFAAEQCDLIFVSLLERDKIADMVTEIRETAAKEGRQVSIWGTAHVVCRETEQEARDYVKYYAEENIDFETAKIYASALFGADTSSHDKFRQDSDLIKTVAATSGNRGIVGSPEQVVAELEEISNSGIDGVGLIFVDYLQGIQNYSEQLLPLMRKVGLRE